jgi:hypothetical protein
MTCYAALPSPTLRTTHVYKFVSRAARSLWLSRTPAARAVAARDARKMACLETIEITYVSP